MNEPSPQIIIVPGGGEGNVPRNVPRANKGTDSWPNVVEGTAQSENVRRFFGSRAVFVDKIDSLKLFS